MCWVLQPCMGGSQGIGEETAGTSDYYMNIKRKKTTIQLKHDKGGT